MRCLRARREGGAPIVPPGTDPHPDAADGRDQGPGRRRHYVTESPARPLIVVVRVSPSPTQRRRPRRRRQPAARGPRGRRRGQRHLAAVPRRPGVRADAGDEGEPGRLAGLARRHRRGPRAVRGGRPPAGADRDEPGRGRELLRGLLQRHPLAAVPRPGREAVVPPRVVGRLRAGQPAVRRARRGGGREGRDGVGAGLPAPAGAADAARPAARPADRVLPAHPVPAGRAVPAAAVAPADPRGPARCRPGRLPAHRRCPELRPPGAPARWPQDAPRPGVPARRPGGDREGVPDLDRHRRLRGAGPLRRGAAALRGDPGAARQPAQGVPRDRPARLHQGHLRPAAGVLAS